MAPHDACTALVHGYLVRQDASRAEMVLSAWASDEPTNPNAAHMRAIYWLWQGDRAGHVLRLRDEGLREHVEEQLGAEGEELNAAEVERIVALRTTPDRPLSVPAIGPPDAQAIARGKALYRTLGCANCHGDEGQGNGATPCYDEGGRACPPRNLVHDPMKGGPEPESLYRRIFLGMPGTPHPSCSNASEDQLVDLVQYCRSLSREPKRERTEHQRAVEASRLEYEISARNPTQTLGGNPQDADKTMPATQ